MTSDMENIQKLQKVYCFTVNVRNDPNVCGQPLIFTASREKTLQLEMKYFVIFCFTLF